MIEWNFGKNYASKITPVSNHMWIVYVLKCENDFYYVGIAKNVRARFEKHINGKGSTFTKTNKPISIIEKLNTKTNEKGLAVIFENNMVIKYAKKHGASMVGGGSFNKHGMLRGVINKELKNEFGNKEGANFYNNNSSSLINAKKYLNSIRKRKLVLK